MTAFVMLGNYSAESIKKISAERTKKAHELIEKFDGKLVAGYALLGIYDVVLIVELPNRKKAMQLSMGLTRLLGITFTTLPAVTFEEFDELMEGM